MGLVSLKHMPIFFYTSRRKGVFCRFVSANQIASGGIVLCHSGLQVCIYLYALVRSNIKRGLAGPAQIECWIYEDDWLKVVEYFRISVQRTERPAKGASASVSAYLSLSDLNRVGADQ